MLTNNALHALLMFFASTIYTQAILAANLSEKTREPIRPVIADFTIDEARASLGEYLFNDKHLAKGDHLACASCHILEDGGDDNVALGTTHDGSNHHINTPTVFNAVYNFRFNWDGSADSMSDQVRMVIDNHLEANTDKNELLNDLRQQKEIRQRFEQIFPDGVTFDNYVAAITEYEKTLVTPGSRFDQYLLGDQDAITDEEISGYQLFKQYGCASCHQGINVGGNLYQKFGIFYDYIAERGNPTKSDLGRMNITGKRSDKYVFKVPSLRNVAVTAPYLHDGQAETLGEAIYIMGKTQLGRELNNEDIFLISLFLETLTGKYKGKYLDEYQQ